MSVGRNSKMRRIAPILIIVASTAGVGVYKYDESTRPTLLVGPMVQMPATDRLCVIWKAQAGQSTGWIEFRESGGANAALSVEEADGRYVGEIKGIRPGATYEYEVFNAGMLGRRVRVSGPHEYKSPAARGTGFRFIAFGDSGVGGNTQSIVANLMAAENPDVVIHTGDLIYPAGASESYPLNFYEPNASMLSSVPFMPTLGNHDVATDKGGPLLREFVLPDNGPAGIEAERNYYFDFGDARFVALDTNPTNQGGAISADEMATVVAPWVRKVLSETDARWKFVYFHQPFYTGSQHAAEGAAYVKNAFAKVFETCGVDVVFCGHNHLYERTAPIVDDKIVDEGKGVVYITTGAGGAQRYPEILPPPEYIRHFNDKVFSFTRVDVTPDQITIRQLDENGKTLDEYVIRHAD